MLDVSLVVDIPEMSYTSVRVCFSVIHDNVVNSSMNYKVSRFYWLMLNIDAYMVG